jgi:hypothetical protein
MHSLLSFWILPDIISENVLQLQNACVCPTSERKKSNLYQLICES